MTNQRCATAAFITKSFHENELQHVVLKVFEEPPGNRTGNNKNEILNLKIDSIRKIY